MRRGSGYAVCARGGAGGFSLIELIVVVAIIAVLLTIALPRYDRSLDRARDVSLEQSLQVMRESIDRFQDDKGRYPETLQELVELRYLRALPVDPVTGSSESWVVLQAEGQAKGSVKDVHSGAVGTTLDGREFSSL